MTTFISILKLIINELDTPDDQGRNWYAWATNQMSHSFLGLFYTGVPLMSGLTWTWSFGICLVLVLTKEGLDLIKIPTWRTALDKLNDISFQILGAVTTIALVSNNAKYFFTTIGSCIVVLILGIIPRAMRALK